MLPSYPRLVVLTVIALTMPGVTRLSSADTITFDSVVTAAPGAPPVEDEGIDFEYKAAPGTDAFLTQNFGFGGRNGGVVPPPDGVDRYEPGIVYNPAGCLLFANTNCVDNGTKYLVNDLPTSMVYEPGGILTPFSLSRFQASSVFQDPSQCPDVAACGGLANASLLAVYGFRPGVQGPVALNVFPLSFGFQTFTLTDPEGDWNNVGRVVFQPRDAQGSVVEGGAYALDNIVASPVPEPASLVLLGTGLIGAGVRRYRRRR